MNLILFDDPIIRIDLLPFTFTRPTGKIRVGILTIDEKWEKWLGVKASFKTEEYLQKKFQLAAADDNLLVNGAVCPDEKLVTAVKNLQPGKFLVKGRLLIAVRKPEGEMNSQNTIEYADTIMCMDKPWKIFQENAAQLKLDFKLITAGRKSAPVQDKHTRIYGEENIFLEDGVDLKAAIINAESGPVYLGKNSSIQEGSVIRGSFALCEGSTINIGSKIRGDVTIGPFSKVGGEVSNSVIFGYSNKAHDGFLGNSVIGEWCNLGADTNTSNLKNNYDFVKLWSHGREQYTDTGLQFCGLMMGDHSKCGINTMFNTGTVVDVFANIFGGDFHRNYIPSFAWGGSTGFTTYQIDKALATAARVMARRNLVLTDIEKNILAYVYKVTATNRLWEKNKHEVF